MTDRPFPLRLWWKLYEFVAMHIGLGSLAVLCLSWLPFAAVLHLVLPSRFGQALGRRAISWGFRAYLGVLQTLCACRLDLSAIDALSKQGPLIIVANHPSLLDAVLITSRLPNSVCVMKSSLMDNLLFGAAARLAGYVPNDLPLTMILQSAEVLKHGGQVLIFPEGTRTLNFPIEPCLPVVGLMAQRCGVPIQSLVIEFSSAYLGKNWPLWRPPTLPLHLNIRLGRRFDPPKDASAFTQSLQTYFHDTLSTERQTVDAAT
jgi:1-acyl-sn-glycerol-3-phosphate acyltransferase